MTEVSFQVAQIKAAEAHHAFEFWSAQVSSSCGSERYEAQNGNTSLEMTPTGTTVGPELFKAVVFSNNKRTKLKGSYLSPGRYGVGRSQFAGSPFSDDSSKLAMIGVKAARGPTFFGKVIESGSGRQLACLETPQAILHHSWSPNSRYWLSQGIGSWQLWDSLKLAFRFLPAGESFPKHALFLQQDRLLTFGEDSGRFSVRQLPYLELLLEHDLGTAEQPAFSFPSMSGGAMILGANVSFPDRPEAKTWFRITVS